VNKTDLELSGSIESHDVPAWLVDVLRISRDSLVFSNLEPESISKELRDKYREAASIALSLVQLRNEKERVGFVPLSLAAYVQGLVKVANVSLTPILKWLGINDLSQLGAESARGFARFAQAIGVDLREALVHLRIGFAEQIDAAPMPLLVARQRSTGSRRSHLEECETVLGEIESEYELDCLRELRRTEFEFRAAYKEHRNTNV
jgi:hypothetical protein